MVTAAEHKLVTIDEFEAFTALPENRDRMYELINGEIVQKVVTLTHGYIVANLMFFLMLFIREHKLGRVGPEMTSRIPTDDLNERIPDISVHLDLSKPVENVIASYLPELAIEVKSPSNTYKELREKARYYLANGSKLVWLVIPEKQLVEVYSADEETILGIDESISGGSVLPGLSIAVRDVFEV